MKHMLGALTVVILMVGCAKDLSDYEVFLEPQISPKPPLKMLVYETLGDPNEQVGEAMGALISTFYKLKRSHDMDFQAPRARWPKPLDTPRDEWVGIFAIPVAESVERIPAEILKEHPKLRLETWSYGTVAEILHKGSYASEGPTVERLHQYISQEGYVITGTHEEEYLKGPGMFGPGNPDRYQTIIRYVVAPAGVQSNSVITPLAPQEETAD